MYVNKLQNTEQSLKQINEKRKQIKEVLKEKENGGFKKNVSL